MTLREQLSEALTLLLVMVVAFPIIFIAADWLRYGGQ